MLCTHLYSATGNFTKLSIIFVYMATTKKKSYKKATAEKPGKPKKASSKKLQQDRNERVDLKKLAKDERTKKIFGTLSLLFSTFLFIAFTSYLFTWREDYSEASKGISVLFKSLDKPISNLMGRLGAYISHAIIFKGFGLASYLFCTFFFAVGINRLFEHKVFNIQRNVKYVTVGLLVASVVFAFVLPRGDHFPYGGNVGVMISDWLSSLLGTVGAAALLFVVVLSYFIWQFNPSFKALAKWMIGGKQKQTEEAVPEAGLEETIPSDAFGIGKSINDLYSENYQSPVERKNTLKGEGGLITGLKEEEKDDALKLIEKDEPEQNELPINEPLVEKEIIGDLLHRSELEHLQQPEEGMLPKKQKRASSENLELEIKTVESVPEEDAPKKDYGDLPPYEPTLDLRDYKYPQLDLLETHGSEKIVQDMNELENNKNQIINTLRNYDIEIQKIFATVGPTVTLYEIVPAPGVRISRIKNLEDDIALSLAALGIRIIAPIPGKGTIGIEVPNVKKTIVSMKTLLSSDKFIHNNYSLPIAIGKKIDNDNYIVDLASMPHLLMAGATGQGKSVGLNAVLVSLLFKKHPSQLKFVLIDPKKVELSLYRHIEKHFLAKLPGEEDAIITDTKKVVHTLNALCIEMDNRYDLLKEADARNIKEYNEKFVKRKLNPLKGHQFLPFIVLVIDEFADLIMTAGKEIELPIARLAQLARAVGIHLIIATQRPSVNIITGTIKANFPSRIGFKVSSKIDSRTILDVGGAEQLIGKGDMLISHNGEITRLQCAFVDTPEVERIVEFIASQRGYPQAFMLPEYVDEKELEGKEIDLADRDPKFEEAAMLIVQNQVGSTSLLQRRMKLGYNRAGRLMDQLEAAGVVGPNLGSKAREVLMKTEAELQEYLHNLS